MIIRKFALLKECWYRDLRANPWKTDFYLEDCFSVNSLNILTAGAILLGVMMIPFLLVPAWREVMGAVICVMLYAAFGACIIWQLIALHLSKKKFRAIIAAIEQSDDGLIYLGARAEYESLQRLANENGGERLYKKQLDALREKVVGLWKVAIDNSGLSHELYEEKPMLPCVEPTVKPTAEPAVLEAMEAADQQLAEKLNFHLSVRQEVERLS